MKATYLLRIDVTKLAAQLADEEHRRISHGDAFIWLSDHGFKTCRRGWYAPSEAVAALDLSVILKAERMC